MVNYSNIKGGPNYSYCDVSSYSHTMGKINNYLLQVYYKGKGTLKHFSGEMWLLIILLEIFWKGLINNY